MSFSELREYLVRTSGKANIPTVVIEKADQKNSGLIRDAIYHIISSSGADELLGQWKQQKVLLKPNFCRVGQYGETTSLQTIDVIISVLKDYSCKLIFGDGMTQSFLGPKGFMEVSAQLSEITRKHGIKFVHFDKAHEKRVPVKSDGFTFYLPACVKEIAGMVNLAALKVHPQMVGSFAVKNHMGLLSGSDCLELHRTGIADGIWRLQSCVSKAVPQQIHVVDALISFQGYQASPSYLKPNLIIGGLNPCAVDFACARVMGIDPETQFPQYAVALQNGFGYGIDKPINFLGANIYDVNFQCHIPNQIINPPASLANVRIHWGEFGYPLNQSLVDLFRAMDCDLPIDIYVGGAVPKEFEKGRLYICLGNASVNFCKNKGSQIINILGDPPAGSIFPNVIAEIKTRIKKTV